MLELLGECSCHLSARIIKPGAAGFMPYEKRLPNNEANIKKNRGEMTSIEMGYPVYVFTGQYVFVMKWK